MRWPSPLSQGPASREKKTEIWIFFHDLSGKSLWGILHGLPGCEFFTLDGLQGALNPLLKLYFIAADWTRGRRRRRSNWQKPEFGSPVQCSEHALKMTLQSLMGQVRVYIPFLDIVCNSENKSQSTFFYAASPFFCLENSRELLLLNLNLNLFIRDDSRICNSVWFHGLVVGAMVFFSLATREQCVHNVCNLQSYNFLLQKKEWYFTSSIIPQKHWFFFQTIFFFIFSFKKLGNFWINFFKSENSTNFCYFFYILFSFLGVKKLPYFRYHKVEKKLCPNFKSNYKNLKKKKEKEIAADKQ